MDAKALQDDLESLGFIPNEAKPEMRRRLKTKGPVIRQSELSQGDS